MAYTYDGVRIEGVDELDADRRIRAKEEVAAKYGWVENLIYVLIALGLIIPVAYCWIRDMAAM